jgi:transcriptional regulator with XRE-family HTH domain
MDVGAGRAQPAAAQMEKGLSQEELAELAGIHQTYLSGVERGKRNPTVSVLQRIAERLEPT